MSDALLQIYYTIFEMSSPPSSYISDEQAALAREIVSRLGEGGLALFDAYHNAFYEGLKREDRAFFLNTLALGMELGRLSVSSMS